MKFNGILKYTLILLNSIFTLSSSFLNSKSTGNIKYSPALIKIRASSDALRLSNKSNFYKASAPGLNKDSDLFDKSNPIKASENLNSKNKQNLKPLIHKNSTLNDTLRNNKTANKPKTKNNTILIRNKFYDICFQVFNYTESSVSCERAEMIEEIFFNCDDRKFEELKYKLSKGEAKNSDKVIKVINQKSFTMEMRKDIFKYSSCLKDTPVLEVDFGVDFINRNPMRINLQNGFLSGSGNGNGDQESKREPEPIFSFSPLGEGMDFKLIIAEINRSQRLLRNSFSAESEIEKLNKLEDIQLSEKDDLVIQQAEIYSENLDELNSDKKHKRLYLCAKNDNNSAYHFLIDKTTRDPRKEKSIMQSAKIKKDFFYEDKGLKTSVRVVYINKTNSCKEEFSLEKIKEMKIKEFLGEKKIGHQSVYNISKANRVNENNSSFRNLIVAIQRYALENENFTKDKDSEYFADGFFDYLVLNKSQRTNENDSESDGVEKKSFENYFKDESDEVFIDKLRARLII